MIAYLKGTLEEIRPGKIVVDVNGIGYNVALSDASIEELPSIGAEVKIFTYLSVREDGMSLYGFLSRDELDMFNLLIGVSGVGPKVAQAILSVAPVPTIKYFIVTSDVNSLSKAPTIGKKTAERIIVDLKDKLGKEPLLGPVDEGKVLNETGLTDDAKDAIEALVALGYDRKEAKTAVLKIEHLEELNTNDILKLSLQYMF